MDKLKEYLLRHKGDLDVDLPARDTWENIALNMSDESNPDGLATKSILQAKSGFSALVARYSAAACLVALAGGGLWLLIKDKKASSDIVKYNGGTVKKEPVTGNGKIENTVPKEDKTPGNDLDRNPSVTKRVPSKARSKKPPESSNEVDIIDKSYSSLIGFQLKKLRSTPLYAENSSYFSFYVEQFKEMEKDEQEVRNDIKKYGLTSEFLEQLINVCQQKLNLLKNLQTEVNKMNNKVREKQTRSATTEVHFLDI